MATEIDKLREVRKVFLITLVLNVGVAIGKLICGFATASLTMQADGFHSTLDSSSNILGMAALSVAAKPPDENHPYGHRKVEAIGAIGISFLMFFACFQVVSEAIQRLTNQQHLAPETTVASYLVMAITMVVNFIVTKYEHKKSVELNNSLLAADAKHTASDIYVSLTVITTLIANQFHMPILDLLGSVIIVVIIIRAGYGIISAHMGFLLDEVVLDPQQVKEVVLQVDGVRGCHKIRSRGAGESVFVDLHIQVDENLSVKRGHEIASEVEKKIASSFPGHLDVLVHIEEHT